jgi:hypothetical protein
MTPTAWHRGAANLLVCIAILAIGSLLLGLLISALFHRSLGESCRLACVFLTSLGMILSLVLWVLGLHAAGRVLLDCGPHPRRTLWLVDAAVSLALGLWGWTLFGPIFIPCAVISTILASGRLQIRESGIWLYWGLARWGKIEFCRVTEESTIVIKMKRHLPFLVRGSAPPTLPAGQRESVIRLLQEHCSVRQ